MIFLFSCDLKETTKDVYYVQISENELEDTTETFEKKVALLEFTGHLCTNCPDAHRSVAVLQNYYKEKLIPLSIHAGYFARTEPGAGFTSDYRTEEGTEIYETFGSPATPVGLVNSLDKNNLSSFSAWSSEIENYTSDLPEIGIKITNSFNNSNRNLQSDIYVEALKDISSELRVIICISEDSITSKQLDNGEVIDNYIHRHVLRKVLSETWGNQLFNGLAVTSGENFTTPVDFIIPENWNTNYCSIIALVYDNISKEILNIEEKNLLIR